MSAMCVASPAAPRPGVLPFDALSVGHDYMTKCSPQLVNFIWLKEERMDFGYFTLSDNHYRDNRRGANALVAEILDQAVYAEQVGLHSAWIGEHHFSTLGVLSCPDLVLAHVAARTTKIRLAPAVTVLPLHNPIRVAEQWSTLDLLSGGRVDFAAGRGYDRREYEPFGASFEDNQSIF